MKRDITIHTVINLEENRRQQFNEDYELMYDLFEATGCRNIPEQMKRMHELIIDNENADGYFIIAEIKDKHTHALVGKYMPKIMYEETIKEGRDLQNGRNI